MGVPAWIDTSYAIGRQWLCLLFVLSAAPASSRIESVERGWDLEPSFDVSAMTEVRVPLGGTALLPCRVRHLAGRPVAWVRRRDWHILTWGAASFTSDGRFRVLSSHSGRDWSLRIRPVQRRDNGTYECQVPTGSGTKSHLFNLLVVVPRAVILGRREYHVGEGSTVSLVCIIDNGPLVAQFTFWQHNGRTVGEGDAASRGVSVATDADGPRPHSRLQISRADVNHAGSYTCGAPGADPDTVQLFISQADKPAAVQHQTASASQCWSQRVTIMLLSTSAITIRTYS